MKRGIFMASFNGKVIDGRLNLRSTCSTSSSSPIQIPNGTSIVVETVSGQHAWFATSYGGHDGYVVAEATPYNGVQIKRNILESGRSQGCPSKSLPGQTTIRLPDKVCQPGSGLPEQTSCSVLQSVFAALGSGSYKTGAAVLPQQKHVPLWRVRRISRVLCV